MPILPRSRQQIPDGWQIWGHSYFRHAFGVRRVNGRADAAVRSTLDIEHPNWRNHAVTGAKLSPEGYAQGGFGSVYQLLKVDVNGGGFGAPWVQYGGAHMCCWGINDLGGYGDTSQRRVTYQHAMRGVIAKCRASMYYEVNDAIFTYSASWNAPTGATREYTNTTVGIKRTSVTATTMTCTIPATFTGGALAFFYIINPGAAGAVITVTGTALTSAKVNGGGGSGTTVSLTNFSPSGELTHNSAVIRVSNLTAANAGQTIIMTNGTFDGGGVIDFDGMMLESANPGPVLWCNIAKLTHAGYAGYATIAANSDATNDASVDTWNAAAATVAAEFDSMVAIIDIDSVIGSTGNRADLLGDGLHPNELGASLIADAVVSALRRIYPSARFGNAAQLNVPSFRWGTPLMPRISANWYTAVNDGRGADYTAVSGDMFALPIMEQHPIAQWMQWSVELQASTAAASIMFAIYDDTAYQGYPQRGLVYPAGGFGGSALALTTGAGVKASSTTFGQNGYMIQPADPGLYWLIMKVTAIGTGTIFRTVRGSSPYMPTLTTAGALLPAAASTSGGAMGYKLTGQGTGTLPTTFPLAAVITSDIPVLGVKYT